MFETEEFKEELERVLISAARRRGLSHYAPYAALFLQRLATQNETILLEAEERKAVWQRRGQTDALNSARELAKFAATLAVRERHDTLTFEDVRAALEAKYCQVWPFCR
jgi:hypothetical protein